MRTIDALRLFNALQALKADPAKYDAKFVYAIGINTRRIQPLWDSYQEALQPWNDTLRAFHEARTALVKTHAKKDELGNPVTETRQDAFGRQSEQYIIENPPVLQEAFNGLLQAHPEAQQADTERMVKVMELDAQDVPDLSIYQVSLDLFPQLSVAQMDELLPMVKEE